MPEKPAEEGLAGGGFSGRFISRQGPRCADGCRRRHRKHQEHHGHRHDEPPHRGHGLNSQASLSVFSLSLQAFLPPRLGAS